jgi:hypothetical protein
VRIKTAHAKTQSRKAEKGQHMTENELAKVVVDAAYQVHIKLGPGLLESVYETVLAYELISHV